MRGKIGLFAGIIILAVLVAAAGTAYYLTPATEGRRTLVVSTTTSLYDTGLLDAIEEVFEQEYPIDVYFISIGTGQAIEHAKRGDADVILVHSPSSEESFLTGGYGVCRKIIAYNFFTIVGPEDDPAGIKGLEAAEALKAIVNAGRDGKAKWVSRGDNSGTHVKEKALWSTAGFDWETLREESWFIESGTGMGRTLLIAQETGAYTLADIGTYLKYYKDGHISLKPLVEQDKGLLNVYSVMAVNPEKVEGVSFEDAVTFIKFLISDKCQTLIGNFKKEEYGQSLFNPAVKILKEENTIAEWIRSYAFFDGYECPPKYWDGHPELYG
ncbi:substrate-binding domain-containing protein [Candidatus Bathyarchaeota archaeon]|nr:substrate-binding domain-containing protein [Candidatus Bathyarchaeota archaeon]